jgi:glycosyltransferase involved in cell wall biosynthesis
MSIYPKVSVILTSYNHDKYLRESIESVLKQTFPDFDLIIWDDGSTDKSWDIIREYSDPRIQAFRNTTQQRGSPISSVYSEIETNEYIAIQHSDDIWEPEKLEKQVNFLNARPNIGAVFSWAHIVDENGQDFQERDHFYFKVFKQPNRSRFEWLNFFFYHGNALCHPSVLIRKKCYDDCGLYRYGLPQTGDFDMWVRLCMKYEIHVLPERLVRFRVRAAEANASGNRPDVRVRGHFEYLQILDNYKKIQTFDDLRRVFPTAEKYARSGNEDIGFILGMIALETKSYKFTELFGLNLLFEAINDPVRASRVSELYGFTQNDFVSLTSKHDVFSTLWIEDLTTKVTQANAQLQKIHDSKAWKIWTFLRRIQAFFTRSKS